MASSMYQDVTNRYNRKVKDHCEGIDPFILDFKKCEDPLPEEVGFFDVVNYCVNKDSTYTNESFKSYKALDAYKYYVDGWVKDIACRKLKNGFIVITKVRYFVIRRT